MIYYKIVENGYIPCVGTGNGGTEINESEYNEILSVIHSAPQETETIGYKLKADLTWEQYEKQPEPYDDEIDSDEALAILTGEQP